MLNRVCQQILQNTAEPRFINGEKNVFLFGFKGDVIAFRERVFREIVRDVSDKRHDVDKPPFDREAAFLRRYVKFKSSISFDIYSDFSRTICPISLTSSGVQSYCCDSSIML